MSDVIFFQPKGPFYLNELIEISTSLQKKIKIKDIKTLDKAGSSDISFFNSIKYKDLAKNTKASACITTKNLEKFLPSKCIKIQVKNVLYSLAKISYKFTRMPILISQIKHLLIIKFFTQNTVQLHLVRIF